MRSYMALPIQFIRGCPFHCEFCDATALMGKAARSKTIQQVIDELQRLYDLGWRGEVSFVDDNIIGNIKRVKELCRALIPWMRERGYPFEFQTQTSLNLAQKKDLLELMVAAGFTKDLRRDRVRSSRKASRRPRSTRTCGSTRKRRCVPSTGQASASNAR